MIYLNSHLTKYYNHEMEVYYYIAVIHSNCKYIHKNYI